MCNLCNSNTHRSFGTYCLRLVASIILLSLCILKRTVSFHFGTTNSVYLRTNYHYNNTFDVVIWTTYMYTYDYIRIQKITHLWQYDRVWHGIEITQWHKTIFFLEYVETCIILLYYRAEDYLCVIKILYRAMDNVDIKTDTLD